MQPPAAVPAALRGRPFTVAMAHEARVPVSRLRSSVFRRLYRGVYVTADTADSLRLRCAAVGLLMPDGAAFSHATSLALRGYDTQADGHIHVSVPAPQPAPRSRAGVSVHRTRLPLDRELVAGIVTTSAGRTMLDLAGGMHDDELVVVGDHLARWYGGVATLTADVVGVARHPGAARVRRALARVREGVDSPQESRLRLAIVRFGLPEPEVNVTVLDQAGEWLGQADLAYLRHRVAMQYEGDVHRSRRRWRQDVARDEAYRAEGWQVLRATADDVLRPRRFCLRLEQALLRSSG